MKLREHAARRAKALAAQAQHERDFATVVARDRVPSERKLLALLRFRVRHLEGLARAWREFARGRR